MASQKKALHLRASRKNDDWFLVNAIDNIARSAILMHKCIRHFRSVEHVFQEAVRNYVIGLVGALETFYRDLFVRLYRDKPDVVSRILQELRPKQKIQDDHPILTAAEVAATVLSFQRLDEIDRALSPLLDSGTYMSAIGSYTAVCAVPSRSENPKRMRLPDDWQCQLQQLLSDRHIYVHDSNAVCSTSVQFMARIEFIVLALTQLTAFMFLERLGCLPDEKNRLPVFLLAEDLIAEDWTDEEPPRRD